LFPDTVQPATIPGVDQVVSPLLSLAVNTYPLMGTCPLMAKFVVRTVPLTSSVWPGAVEPIPTFPLVTTRAPCALLVPMPTLFVNDADVPTALNVVNPDNVFSEPPLCVYAPDVAIPVVAVI